MRFKFRCAQNIKYQREARKVEDKAKQRNKERMICFDCNGWLHIKFSIDDQTVNIKLIHNEAHIPYWRIDVPAEVKQFVEQHADLKMDEVRKLILFNKYMLIMRLVVESNTQATSYPTIHTEVGVPSLGSN